VLDECYDPARHKPGGAHRLARTRHFDDLDDPATRRDLNAAPSSRGDDLVGPRTVVCGNNDLDTIALHRRERTASFEAGPVLRRGGAPPCDARPAVALCVSEQRLMLGGGCRRSSNAQASGPSGEEPETAPLVKEQQSRAALLLVIPCGRPRRGGEDDRIQAKREASCRYGATAGVSTRIVRSSQRIAARPRVGLGVRACRVPTAVTSVVASRGRSRCCGCWSAARRPSRQQPSCTARTPG
jgi:hypothetical protein